MRGRNPAEKAAAIASRDWLRSLLLNRCVTLTECGKEKWGRVLAEVCVDGVNVSDALLAAGHAVPYTGGAKTPFGSAPSVLSENVEVEERMRMLPPAPPSTRATTPSTPLHSAFELGALVTVEKGKYAGRRGAVRRLTKLKVVVALDDGNNAAAAAAATVTLPPKSLRLSVTQSHPSDDDARAAASSPWPPAACALPRIASESTSEASGTRTVTPVRSPKVNAGVDAVGDDAENSERRAN